MNTSVDDRLLIEADMNRIDAERAAEPLRVWVG